MEKIGEFTIKGSCYKNFISILWKNGYQTEVFTNGTNIKNWDEVEHTIRVYDEKVHF